MAYELCSEDSTCIPGISNTGLFTTSDLNTTDKLEFWRDVVHERIIPLDFDVVTEMPFEASLHWTQIGRILLSDIKATPHIACRTTTSISRSGSDALIFNFLHSGQCEAEQDCHQTQLNTTKSSTGMAWFCNAARPYNLRFSQSFHLTTVRIPKNLITRNISGTDLLVAQNLSTASQLYPLVQSYILQLVNTPPALDDTVAEKIATNLADLIAALISERLTSADASLSDSKIASLLRIRAYVEAHLHEPDLNPDKVAAAVRMSSRYINQLLQAEETSLSRFIWQRRLQRVSRLLRDPANQGNHISSYAFACGFNDMTHFSKAFRRQFNMSPSEYRQFHLSQHGNLDKVQTG